MQELLRAFIIIAAGILLFYYLFQRNRDYAKKRLSNDCRAQAVVIKKGITATGSGRFTDASFRLTYEFYDSANHKIVHTATMYTPPEGWDALKEGSAIEICYGPDNPKDSFPVSYVETQGKKIGDKSFIKLIMIIMIILYMLALLEYVIYGNVQFRLIR